MKKLSLILLLFCSVKLSAQTFVTFDFENSSWRYGVKRCWSDGPLQYDCYNYIYTVNCFGDTIVNNIAYKKSQMGLIRTEGRKVYAANVKYYNNGYYYYNLNNSEYILYDFDLAVGDTFALPNLYDTTGTAPTLKMIVVAKDSINTPVGYRNTIGLDFISYYPQSEGVIEPWDMLWIEGIGSNYGLFYNVTQMYAGLSNIRQYFLCYYNNQYVYGTGTCDFLAGIDEDKHNQSISVYPNPANSILTIKTPNLTGEIIVELYNNWGQVVYTKTTTTTELQPIEVSALSNGIYYLKLQNNGQFYSQKVVIQK